MNNPELSIIIPVYNVAPYINDCLSSIKNQSFKDWECILIDDGSTDFSGLICDSYAKKDSRFKVIHQKNAGVSSARNVGLNLATSPLLSFIDPDDFIDKDFYMQLISVLQKEKAQYVAASVNLVDEAGSMEAYKMIDKFFKAIYNRTEVYKVYECNEAVLNNLKSLLTYGCWGSVFTKRLWGNARFPDYTDLGEDLAIIPSIISNATKAAIVPEAIYYYRIRTGSLLRKSTSKERYLNFLKASKQMLSVSRCVDAKANYTFSKLKFENDIGMYIDYLRSNPDTQKSKLLHFFELLQESQGI